MSTEPGAYLLRLTARLAEGLERVPSEIRERHTAYLVARQNSDGGFSGREGGSDLYYTGFALRGLLVLGGLTTDLAKRASDFLKTSLTRQTSPVDFFSLIYSAALVRLVGAPDVFAQGPPDWPERVQRTLDSFRTSEGGYAKEPNHHSSSTYHTFLVGLCLELLGQHYPRKEEVVRYLHSRRREDGGFVEIGAMRRSGTNPTAAAVGALQLLGEGLTDEIRAGVVGLLTALPSSEGGLRANGRIPMADLLSTFTGLWTLETLEALTRVNRDAARRYALQLQGATGGFRGGLWDDRCDVEYTFYGLGVLGLLFGA